MRTVVFVVWPAFRNASGNNWTEAKKKTNQHEKDSIGNDTSFFFLFAQQLSFFFGWSGEWKRTHWRRGFHLYRDGRTGKNFRRNAVLPLVRGERDLFYFTTPFAVRLDVEFPSGADGHGLTWRNYRAEREKRGTGPFRPERPITSPRKKKKSRQGCGRERVLFGDPFCGRPTCAQQLYSLRVLSLLPQQGKFFGAQERGKNFTAFLYFSSYSRIKIKCLTVGGRPSLCNQKKNVCRPRLL